MKLNEQATIELTASTWLVIAREKVSKAAALRLLGFESNTEFIEDEGFVYDFTHDCPLCEHVVAQGKSPRGHSLGFKSVRECAHICLLDGLWPRGCEHPTSPFAKWLNACYAAVEKSYFAIEIAEFAGTLAGTWNMELEELL